MTIGEKIKNRRKEMGYTLEELANKLGVVRSAVFKWEKNECNPYRHIQKLAEILKVNPLYFTEWADNTEDKGGRNMKLNRKDIFKVFVGACDTYEPNDYAFIGTLDECNEYINKYNHQKQAYIEPAGYTRTEITVGLCSGRHNLPGVEEYIFEDIADPMDFDSLEKTAYKFVGEAKNNGVNLIELYVTGFTPALASVIKACNNRKISLKLMHFNKDTNGYKAQFIM